MRSFKTFPFLLVVLSRQKPHMLCPQSTNVFNMALLKKTYVRSSISLFVSNFPDYTAMVSIWSHHLTSLNLSILNSIKLGKYLSGLSYSINYEEKNISFLLHLFNFCNSPLKNYYNYVYLFFR